MKSLIFILNIVVVLQFIVEACTNGDICAFYSIINNANDEFNFLYKLSSPFIYSTKCS